METVEAPATSLQQEEARTIQPSPPPPVARYRFTVTDYHKLEDAGIFPPDTRLELIHGEVLKMAPVGHEHVFALARLQKTLETLLGDRALVLSQSPLVITEHGEPQPDIMLLKPPFEGYKRLPQAEDVLLLIEVSKSTLPYDRTVKTELYAGAGIAEYWIVNLQEGTLEVYRDPQNGHYRSLQTLAAGTAVAPLAFPDVPVAWG